MNAAAGAGRGRRGPRPPRATSTFMCRSAPSAATTASSLRWRWVAAAGAPPGPRPSPGRRMAPGPRPPPGRRMAPRPPMSSRLRPPPRIVSACSTASSPPCPREWRRERLRFGVRSLETVFVGGGTPSLLGAGAARAAPGAARAAPVGRGPRSPSRPTPRTSPAQFADWAAARRLRVSLGVQSFDERLRAALGRRAAADPAAAFATLREAGVGAGQKPDAAVTTPAGGALPAAPSRRRGRARTRRRSDLRSSGAAGLPTSRPSWRPSRGCVPTTSRGTSCRSRPGSVLAARGGPDRRRAPGLGHTGSCPTTRRWP